MNSDYPNHAGAVKGSATSEAAAADITESGDKATASRRVYDGLKECARTANELARDLSMSIRTCSARMSELRTAGIIAPLRDTDGDSVVEVDSYTKKGNEVYRVIAPFPEKLTRQRNQVSMRECQRAISSAIFQIEAGCYAAAIETLKGVEQ